MATSQEIAAHIQQVEQVRQQAAREEQAKLARENANQRAIQEADAELSNLRLQQAEARFNEVLRESDAKVAEQNTLLGMQVFPVLDALEASLKMALPLVNQIDALYQQQQQKHDEAMAAAGQLVTTMRPVAASHHFDSTTETVQRNANVMREREDQITPALTPAYALLDWIHRAQDDTQRRLRSGVVYALTGHVFEVTGKTPPADRTKLRDELKRRVRRMPGWS